MSRKKREAHFTSFSIRVKLLLVMLISIVLIFLTNVLMYFSVNQMTRHLDTIYAGNVQLSELEEALERLQESVEGYLNTKTTDSMQQYYERELEFARFSENLSDSMPDDSLGMMERNIRCLSESYLKLTSATIEAKRGRNVEKYREYFEQAGNVYKYLSEMITSLNTQRFRNNTENYERISSSLSSLEKVSLFVFVLIALFDLLIIFALTQRITDPLSQLSAAADQVAEGKLTEVNAVPVHDMDEIGIVTVAFNQMVSSIPGYLERLKESMEKEQELKEKELLMEAHLKDARLKYLQAQINPHFLFNTLNAGAQLAMLEGADRTYEYVQQVASFFRYNIRKDNDETTLAEEIKMVDTYIYILNVRFAGDIHFIKNIEDEELLRLPIPGMILQPIVENSVNYGVRAVEREGRIELSVYRLDDKVCISVADNGAGIEKEKLEKILAGDRLDPEESGNGVGIHNVMQRLHLFYDGKDSFEMISEGKDMGTEVVITIPDLTETGG